MKVYLASPLFNEEEIGYIEKAEKILRARGFYVYSPREHEIRDEKVGTQSWSLAIFQEDRSSIDMCDILVALYHGNYSDTGTAWECGYAYAIHKPVFIVQLGSDSNLMMHEGCRANLTLDQLEDYDFESMPGIRYKGKMY